MAIIPSSILGLGTEVRVWSQFHIFFDWRISNVESADRTVKLLLQIWRELTLSRERELDSSKVCQTSSTAQLDFVLVLTFQLSQHTCNATYFFKNRNEAADFDSF